MTAHDSDSIRPTTSFWQAIQPASLYAVPPQPPFRYGYPARLPDGRYLELPLRRIAGTADRAVASLIANQASFEVAETLAGFMTDLAHEFAAEVVIGLPTLGLVFAPAVARGLGFANYVPFGYSRKFWYDDALSVPVASLTTPGMAKALYVDPNLLPRLAGLRAVIVDDAVSSGQTAAAAIGLATFAGAQPVGIVVAMLQGNAWRQRLATVAQDWPGRVRGVFESPRFERVEGGWAPIAPDCEAI